jgi:hypothetical protein
VIGLIGGQEKADLIPVSTYDKSMDIDQDKVDQAVLALLSLGRHEGYRTWKAFGWESMNPLHQKGYISDPVTKSKPAPFTEQGLRESERLFERRLMTLTVSKKAIEPRARVNPIWTSGCC